MNAAETAEKKAALRKELRAMRRALTPDEVKRASLAVFERFTELPEVQKAQLILSYMPSKNELDCSYINEKLTEQGKKVAYPLCVDNGGLRLFVPDDENAFNTGAYGIKEPDPVRSSEVAPEQLDLIIVPAVAFTRECMRLGQGGGYYDRLLMKTNAVTVGVGYDFQLLSNIPLEPHDRALNIVVTPCGVYRG